jgi:hypothetical protein
MMKNSFQDSFKLLMMLKRFVQKRGQLYKVYFPIMHNNSIIAQFIEKNNHRISSNVTLSFLLDSLLDNATYDVRTARRN